MSGACVARIVVIPVPKNVTFFPDMETILGAPTTEYEKAPGLFELGSTNVNETSDVFLANILKFVNVGVACKTVNDASIISVINRFIVCEAVIVVEPTPIIFTFDAVIGPLTQLLFVPVNAKLVIVP